MRWLCSCPDRFFRQFPPKLRRECRSEVRCSHRQAFAGMLAKESDRRDLCRTFQTLDAKSGRQKIISCLKKSPEITFSVIQTHSIHSQTDLFVSNFALHFGG